MTLGRGTLFLFVLVAGWQRLERWPCCTRCPALRWGEGSPPTDPAPREPPVRRRGLCKPVVTRPCSLAELKQITWLSTVGLVMVIFGDCLRKAAMLTAGSNFNHIVQNEKSDTHTLVTSGVYGWFRHPSYVGWFYWSIGTQVPYTMRSDASILQPESVFLTLPHTRNGMQTAGGQQQGRPGREFRCLLPPTGTRGIRKPRALRPARSLGRPRRLNFLCAISGGGRAGF